MFRGVDNLKTMLSIQGLPLSPTSTAFLTTVNMYKEHFTSELDLIFLFDGGVSRLTIIIQPVNEPSGELVP